ncbi:MAG: PqqD family peptide modification chaperone [Gammaproteobacteria bacterium]|nr:PqqD family peptide modification chaperone [Gammaproteobacteria bacterium]
MPAARTSEIFFIPFGDGGALFYPGIQRLWALNNLAAYIWFHLDENISKAALINNISKNYSVNYKTAENDLANILEHFKDEGLLVGGLPTQPDTTKIIDCSSSKQQYLNPKKYDESEDRCLIEVEDFRCQIFFPDKNLLNNFIQLYHYFISEEYKDIKHKIFIFPSEVKNDCFDIYLDGQCVHENISYIQIDSVIHFVFFSRCAKYLSKQGKLMFHASALQKSKQMIVLPANSGSGKSTLAVALSACDWRCYTDELAVLDPDDLSITPLPIPIRIRSGSFIPLLPFYEKLPELPEFNDLYENQIKWIILPKEQLASKTESARITSLIFPKYSEKLETRLAPLDKFLALERLTATGSSERDMTLEDAKAMVRLIEQTPCYELIFSDLQEAITAIESITNKLEERHSGADGNPES